MTSKENWKVGETFLGTELIWNFFEYMDHVQAETALKMVLHLFVLYAKTKMPKPVSPSSLLLVKNVSFRGLISL